MTDQRTEAKELLESRLELRRPFIEQADAITRLLTKLRQEFEDAKAALRATVREKRRSLADEYAGDVRGWWDAVMELKAWKRDELAELRDDYEDDRRDLEAARGRVAAAMKQAEREAGYR